MNEIVKDEEQELLVPLVWRPIFEQIIRRFVQGDYLLSDLPHAHSVDAETADQIENAIRDYGEALIELPPDTWQTSIYIWMDPFWEVLIDLWTSEGQSDLVLHAKVYEEDDYMIHIHFVYIP